MSDFIERCTQIFSKPLKTAHLTIKPWFEEDAAAIAALHDADDHAYAKYTFQHNYDESQFPFSEHYVRTIVLPSQEGFNKDQNVFPLALHEQSTGKIIGEICVRLDEQNRIRMAPFILPSEKRRGFAREAYEALLKHGTSAGLIQGSEFYVESFVENTEAHAFFLSMGFKKVAEQPTADSRVGNHLCAVFTRAIDTPKTAAQQALPEQPPQP